MFRNSFEDIEYALKTLGDSGTRFEFECYDTSHLYNLAHFLERGLVKPPLFVQTVFGILGGIGPHPEDVMHMRRTADRLFGDAVPVVGAGRGQEPDGDRRPGRGHGRARARGAGGLAVDRQGPARAVERRAGGKARQILEGLGLEVATPDEAREILSLKGGDQVAF